jgi:hypothetical protein
MLYQTKLYTSLEALLCPENADDDPVGSKMDSKRYSLFFGETDLQTLPSDQNPIDYIGKQDATVVLQVVGKHAKKGPRDSIELGLMAEIQQKN